MANKVMSAALKEARKQLTIALHASETELQAIDIGKVRKELDHLLFVHDVNNS